MAGYEPPLLWLIVGPNGSGKSTYYETRIRPSLAAEFVNADLIAAQNWPGDVEARAYEAARRAEQRRKALVEERRSFVAETVFSHPSKLDLIEAACAAGYQVWVTFIYLESASIAVERVDRRVRLGGHRVPVHKIMERYERMAPLAVAALQRAHRGFVVDNSDPTHPLRDVLSLERGEVVWVVDDVPAWTRRLFGL